MTQVPTISSKPPRSTVADWLGALAERPVLAGVVFAAGLATILGAWGFELIGGYLPCKLCLDQRDPYYWGLPLVLLAIACDYYEGPGWLTRVALIAAAAIFVYGGGLGVYQSGAEWGFWRGPVDCAVTRGGEIPSTAGDLLGSMAKVKIVDCTKVQWRMFGLSFAGYNVLVSAALALAAAYAALFGRRS